jgi:hypothetical protein
VTPRGAETGALSKQGMASWQVFALVAGIVWSTVQTVAALRAMTKTDEILVKIAVVEQKVEGLNGFKADHDSRLHAIEQDAQRTRERLAGVEAAKITNAKPANYTKD